MSLPTSSVTSRSVSRKASSSSLNDLFNSSMNTNPSPPSSPTSSRRFFGRKDSVKTKPPNRNSTNLGKITIDQPLVKRSRSSFSLSNFEIGVLNNSVNTNSNANNNSLVEIIANKDKDQIISDELLSDMKVLLRDHDLLLKVFQECMDMQDFATLLYTFFEGHDQERELMYWAISQEVQSTKDPNELFRVDCMATKLFYALFFGDLGKRYLTLVMEPLITDILKTKHSLEIEEAKAGGKLTPAELEKNCSWFIERSIELLKRLNELIDTCPLALREALLILREEVSQKFPASTKLVGSIIFLRFFCPTLVFPIQYKLIDIDESDISDYARRGLIIASKLLQTVANGAEIEDTKPHAGIINQFIRDYYCEIEKFTHSLMEEQKIHTVKQILEASIIPKSASQQSAAAHVVEDQLADYLRQQQLLHQDQSVIEFHSKYNSLLEHYDNIDDYKLVASSKKSNLFVYQRKIEGSASIAFKSIGKFKCDLKVVGTFLANNGVVDKRVTSVNLIQRYDECHSDWYMTTALPFPAANRDWVYTLYSAFETENKYVSMSYSITRPDTPVSKKFTRAHIIVSGNIVERDALDPSNVIYTHIYHVDPKGGVPSWLVNGAGKDTLKNFKKLKQYLTSLDSSPTPIIVDPKE